MTETCTSKTTWETQNITKKTTPLMRRPISIKTYNPKNQTDKRDLRSSDRGRNFMLYGDPKICLSKFDSKPILGPFNLWLHLIFGVLFVLWGAVLSLKRRVNKGWFQFLLQFTYNTSTCNLTWHYVAELKVRVSLKTPDFVLLLNHSL